MKPKIKLTKQRGDYYVAAVDGTSVGTCSRAENFMAPSGHAGWNFKPNTNGEQRGMKAMWETTPKRAVEASLRDLQEVA